MISFFEVADRDDGHVYAVATMTDQLDPGRSRLYRWLPNVLAWVRDDDRFRDLRSHFSDRLNEFTEITPSEAMDRVENLKPVTAEWVLAQCAAIPERLWSGDLGL